MIPPPSFVIRNSVHNTTENVCGVPSSPDENEVESIGNAASRIRSSFIPAVVQLVQSKNGEYMLDFACENDAFIANILSTNDKDDVKNYETYIDENAWDHLLVYSELVGKPITKDKNEYLQRQLNVVNPALDTNARSFVLLVDDLMEVSHTLLDVSRLFSWQFIVDKICEGKIQWRDVRSCLSIVRKYVPFATHEGLLLQVKTITFQQFVVLARMIQRHIESPVSREVPKSADAQISTIFPPFDSISDAEKEIELSASIRDREVQNNAKASGIIIPTSELNVENEDWRQYIKWWSTNSEARCGFCIRELKFAENDIQIQRNAMESGISERDTLGKSFGSWYYGSGRDQIPGDCGTSTDALSRSKAQMVDSTNTSSIQGFQGEETSFAVTPAFFDSDGDTCINQSPVLDIMSIVGSKIKPSVNAISMRYQLLRRATAQFDTLKLLFSKKKNPQSRGIKLFRSKVRLVIVIRRLLGETSYQLSFVAPENLDIFCRHSQMIPMKATSSGVRVDREVGEKAIAHRNQMLSRRIVKSWMSWTRENLAEQQRKEDMVQNATAAHQRTLTLRCFRALRIHCTQQKSDNTSSVNETTSKLQKEIDFGIRSPSVDDKLSFLVNELDDMELVFGRNRPSGVDVLVEDLQHLAGRQDLRSGPTQEQPPANIQLRLLDKATLQRMKQEKLAGASNLFDVPLEVIYSSYQSDVNNVEYKNRETVSRIVDRV